MMTENEIKGIIDALDTKLKTQKSTQCPMR